MGLDCHLLLWGESPPAPWGAPESDGDSEGYKPFSAPETGRPRGHRGSANLVGASSAEVPQSLQALLPRTFLSFPILPHLFFQLSLPTPLPPSLIPVFCSSSNYCHSQLENELSYFLCFSLTSLYTLQKGIQVCVPLSRILLTSCRCLMHSQQIV